jgi:hypothetical protein
MEAARSIRFRTAAKNKRATMPLNMGSSNQLKIVLRKAINDSDSSPRMTRKASKN